MFDKIMRSGSQKGAVAQAEKDIGTIIRYAARKSFSDGVKGVHFLRYGFFASMEAETM